MDLKKYEDKCAVTISAICKDCYFIKRGKLIDNGCSDYKYIKHFSTDKNQDIEKDIREKVVTSLAKEFCYDDLTDEDILISDDNIIVSFLEDDDGDIIDKEDKRQSRKYWCDYSFKLYINNIIVEYEDLKLIFPKSDW